MSQRLILLLVCLLSFLLMEACGSPSPSQRHQEIEAWFTPNEKIKVLATTAMICDLVQHVGGNTVHVIPLIQGDLDPHSYELVKGDDEKLTRAELIFYNGLGLEHGGSTRRYLQNTSKAIPLGNLLLASHPEALIYIDTIVDPHIWMDMRLWAETIPFIVDALSQYDPERRTAYEKKGEELRKHLEEKHADLRAKMQTLPASRRYLVTSHDAFHYFTRAYLADERETTMEQWHPRVAAPEGLAPESQISAHDIRNIIEHLQAYDIHVLFTESNVSQDSLRKILDAGKSMGLDLVIAEEPLYSDAMGPPGSSGDTYVKMMEHNSETIYNHLLSNGRQQKS